MHFGTEASIMGQAQPKERIMPRKTLGIMAIAAALALMGVIAITGLWSPQPVANIVQAHEDGTDHIHPTPTPTPYPALGLAGQVSLHTEAYYHESDHSLLVVTIVNNAPPPPDGWQFQRSQWDVNVEYQGWSFGTSCEIYPQDEHHHHAYEDGRACEIPMPDYVDFDKLTEPMLVRVGAYVRYAGDDRPGELDLYENIYIDLFDRGNWR